MFDAYKTHQNPICLMVKSPGFYPLEQTPLRPRRATSWLPRDDRPRSTPLDAQSRTSPAKSAKCPWLGKSSSFVVKLLGNITSSSFFRTPKWWEKNTSNEASCLFSKTLGMELMEPWKSHANTGIYLTSRTGRRNRSPQKHMEFAIPHCLILTSRSLIHGCWPTFHLSKVDDLFSIKATNTMWLCVFENSGSPRKDHGSTRFKTTPTPNFSMAIHFGSLSWINPWSWASFSLWINLFLQLLYWLYSRSISHMLMCICVHTHIYIYVYNYI